MNSVVREGFICSVCKLEFSSPEILTKHFYVHIENDERKTIKKTKKIPQIFTKKFYSCKIKSSSLTEEFRTMRQKSNSSKNFQVNKLVLTLEKILDYNKSVRFKDRKSYEESIVSWLGQDSNNCPICCASFGVRKCKSDTDNIIDKIIDSGNLVIRFKHHCRLCGFIMCGDCSFFLKESYAKKLLESITQKCSDFTLRNEFESFLNLTPKYSAVNQILDGQSDNNESTGSSQIPSSSEYKIRLCYHCLSMLNEKYELCEKNNPSSDRIISVYSDLRGCMVKIKTIMEEFSEILQSLSLGETKYTIEGAQTIRQDLIELFNKNQEASFTLNQLKESMQAEPTLVNLLNKILYYNQQFIKIYMPSLKSLPTIEDYEKLKMKNKLDLADKWTKIDEINHQGIIIEQKDIIQESLEHRESNWIPKPSQSSGKLVESDDEFVKCLVQQIENVIGYLETAKKDERPEEVRSLSDNLTQLQMALAERQKELYNLRQATIIRYE